LRLTVTRIRVEGRRPWSPASQKVQAKGEASFASDCSSNPRAGTQKKVNFTFHERVFVEQPVSKITLILRPFFVQAVRLALSCFEGDPLIRPTFRWGRSRSSGRSCLVGKCCSIARQGGARAVCTRHDRIANPESRENYYLRR
jgi:hypothetical protein